MATRKALVLVSGLFQELNSSSDKLDFAGNSTTDLSEGSNQYFTTSRARGSVSVTDSGGDGSLAYNSTSGVITYTGPSASEARAHFSVASGSGLSYNSSSGEFGTSAIPNSQLANDDITIGSTAVALGATQGTFTGLTSLASTTLISGVADAANSIKLASGNITFEGSTADANETILTAADATGGDKTLTLPNETGTILSTASSIANSNLANSAVTIGSTSISLGGTVTTFAGLSSLTSTTLVGTTIISGSADAANSIKIASGNIIFEGSSANDFETTLTVTNPTADRTITFPDAAGTVALLESLSVAAGSGLSYNSSTGQFGTSSIPNAQLANSTITIGSTAVALGSSITSLTGISTITTTGVTNLSGELRANGNIRMTNSGPKISFIDAEDNPDFEIGNLNGLFRIRDITNSANRLTIGSGGTVNVAGNLDVGAGLDVTGDITATGHIDLPDASTIKLGDSDEFQIQHTAGGASLITETGSGNLEIRATNINLKDSNQNNKLATNSLGVAITGNLDVSNGVDVTGDITVTGTVDGKDVATLATESFATAIAVALG